MQKEGIIAGFIIDNNLKLTEDETVLPNGKYYKITKQLSEGIKIDNKKARITENTKYEATLTIEGEYVIDSLTVKMGGQVITTGVNNVVDVATGKIKIENVTGDIEITATTKQININITTPIIGTSNPPTFSVDDYSKDKGTSLYINFNATIEGNLATIKYKEDETRGLPFEVKENGIYTFLITATYNSKTIKKEIEIEVNKYKTGLHLVKYDAGVWTKEEIDKLKLQGLYNINSDKKVSTESDLNCTFGGFTYVGDTENANLIQDGIVTTSRNNCVGWTDNIGFPAFSGWQILELEDEHGNKISSATGIDEKLNNIDINEKIYVTKLIHAGIPENFVYQNASDVNFDTVQYILSSGTRFTYGNTHSARNWDMYIDKNQRDLIDNVHAMTYQEADSFGVHISGGVSQSNYGRRNGYTYILSSGKYENGCMGAVNYMGDLMIQNGGMGLFGVRPIVDLRRGVYIANGKGTENEPYILGKD